MSFLDVDGLDMLLWIDRVDLFMYFLMYIYFVGIRGWGLIDLFLGVNLVVGVNVSKKNFFWDVFY